MKKYFLLFPILAMAVQTMGQVTVMFRLDMDSLIRAGFFSKTAGDRVCVRGSFNHWTGIDHTLKDASGRNVYSGAFILNGSKGDKVDYKFVIVKADDRSFWESNPNPGNPDHGNRQFILGTEKMVLPVAHFKHDEYISYPVIFTRKKLQEDFIQFREILETTHPALYDYTSKEVLDSIFERNFSLIDTALEFRSFLVLMTEVISKVGCGHSSLWVPDAYWNVAPERLFPLELYLSDNKALVTGSYLNDHTIPAGSEILGINNMPMPTILTRLSDLTSADGFNRSYKAAKVGQHFSVKYALAYGFPDTFRVDYRIPGNQQPERATVLPVSRETVEKHKPDLSELSCKEIEGTQTAILTINTFAFYDRVDKFRNFIDSVFQEIHRKEIRNLILDLRGNSGGDPFCASWLWSYLEPEPLPYFQDHYGKYDTLACPVPLPPDHFKGRLFTLIDGHGFSTTGHFCGLLKYHHVGKFIGSELGSTFTCTGNATYPPLKHTGIMVGTARISRYTAAVKNMDPMRGVLPDYRVRLTQEDIINRRDPVMDLALRLAGSHE